jgi:hypothetical protein
MPVMWGVLSALFVLALWGMTVLLGRSDAAFTAGQWAVYLAWLLWTLFGVAFVWTSLAERERRAAGVGALIFGGVAVIVGAVLVWLWVLV